MANIPNRFTKGIILRGESSDSENEEGSLFLNSSSARIKTYVEGAVREVITSSQGQYLTNKTISTAENTIQVSATGVTATELDAALEEIQSNIVAENSRAVAAENSLASQIGNISTTAANVGTGIGVFKEKLGSELKFKSLKAGSNVAITATGTNEITISAAGAGGTFIGEYPILDNQTNATVETLTDKSKMYDITYSVNRSVVDLTSEAFNSEIISKGYKFNSSVSDFAVQPDGKYLISGAFSNYDGQTGKSYLIRLNSDGTEDTAFSANAIVNGTTAKFNSTLLSIAIQSDGKILVGGVFTNYNNQTGKSYLIRLNADGTEDTTFSTNAVVNGTTARFNGSIFSIAIQSDGKILIGGDFTFYNAQTGKSRLIRLNADGTEDTAFSANAVVNGTTARFSSSVEGIKVQSDGKILVGGNFITYNAQTGKNRFIRLNTDGTEDTTFSANAVVNGTTPRFSSIVNDVALQSDGKILVGGNFTLYSGQTGKDRLIRFNSDGTEDTEFSANAIVNGTTARFSSSINAIEVQPDSKILVSGGFTNYSGQTGKDRLIRLNSDGTEDTAFSANAVVNGTTPKFTSGGNIALKLDGSILVGGGFTSYSGFFNMPYFIELNNSGNLINFEINYFSPNINDIATASRISALQSDGKILVGGSFQNYYNQIGKSRLIRLNADGTEDTAFSANAVVNGTTPMFSGVIISIAIQSDGKILIGGDFTLYNGQAGKSYLIRLNADGTEDTTFSANAVVNGVTPRFTANVNAITIQPDGKILVGGNFTVYSSQAGKNRLIRLNSDGTEDTTFSTNAVVNGTTARFSSNINAIVVQSDNKIVIGGNFTNYNAQTGKDRLIRLNSDGTEDTTFSTNAVVNGTTARFSSSLSTLALQSDGKILVGGAFQNYSASTGKSRLIRLNSDGTEDTTFSTNAVVSGTTAKFSNTVQSVAVQSDGKIVVGGDFINYNAQTGKSYFIRFFSNGTEDTAFSNVVVVNGTNPRFSAGVRSVVVKSSSEFLIGGAFSNYSTYQNLNSFFMLLVVQTIRAQIGKLQAVPTSTGFSFSTPTVLGPEVNYETGVTLSFNSDGTIKYSSTTLNNPPEAIDLIKIDKKPY